MNVQAAPSTYTPVGNAPVLGAQVPGTTGGLPALSGLSVTQNPMAQQLQSMGRGEDTMLVHMTPNEVNSLQGLAMAAGGSLTINPQTGLPEAGWLGKLLPLIAGIGLNFVLPGSGGIVAALGGKAAAAGLLTGAATTAITGNLQKGLMAGLGAFGGASLAGGIQGALGAGAKTAASGAIPVGAEVPGTLVQQAAGAANATGQTLGQAAVNFGQQAAQAAQAVPMATVPGAVAGAAGTQVPTAIAQQALQEAAIKQGIQQAAQTATTQAPGALARFGQGFAQTAKGNMTGLLGKAAVPAAGLGVLSSISSAMQPGFRNSQGQIDNAYEGPYYAQQRKPIFAGTTEDILAGDGGQQRFFDVGQPEIYNVRGQLVQPGSATAPGTMIRQNYLLPTTKKKNSPMYGFRDVPYMGGPAEEEEQAMGTPFGGINPLFDGRFAKGGEVELADGAFVVDARTVSEIGNGSSNAGIEVLSRMGGRPVRGSGDGVSDSVPARIGRDQPARVARDEVVFSPEAVRRVGGGDEKRGAQKLYALMEKAHKARRKSERGKDTKLRRGLA